LAGGEMVVPQERQALGQRVGREQHAIEPPGLEPAAASPSDSAVDSKSAGWPSTWHFPASTRLTASSGPSCKSRRISFQVAAKPARRRSVQAGARPQEVPGLGRYGDQGDDIIG